MDSEDWAIYREAMRRGLKTEKSERLKENMDALNDKGLSYTLHNEGLHAVITAPNGRKYDLWPSTGKYRDRTTGRHYNGGAHRLFKHMGIE